MNASFLLSSFDAASKHQANRLAAESARANAAELRALSAECVLAALRSGSDILAASDERLSVFARDVYRTADIESACLSRIEASEAVLANARQEIENARADAEKARGASSVSKLLLDGSLKQVAQLQEAKTQLQEALSSARAEGDATSALAKEQSSVISRLAARLAANATTRPPAPVITTTSVTGGHPSVPPPPRSRLVRADGRAIVRFVSGAENDVSSPKV